MKRKEWFFILALVSTAIFAGLALDAFSLSKVKKDQPLKMELRPPTRLQDDVELLIPFAIDSLCRITDSSRSLDGFLEELDGLLAGKDTVIQIVHIGDSHVQAGFYPGQVMRMMHQAFGNAGRGWISPLKLAKINEPKDYFITSSKVNNWIAGRCIQIAPKSIWGLGGLGIQTASKTIDFTVSVIPKNGAGYGFNKVLLFRDDLALPMLPAEEDTSSVSTAWGMDTGLPHIAVDTFRMDTETQTLNLQSAAQIDLPPQFDPAILKTPNCYYGFSLMNGNSGILYHAIGQNGAMFKHFSSEPYLQQLALLQPSLIIITLGTNEAHTVVNLTGSLFELQVDRFVQLIRRYLPTTAILLTTPAENFKRTRKGFERNEKISLVAQVIKEYAQREGLACFDLYGMTGGANSCLKWQEAKLLGRDRVHFSVDGYYEQGKMLFKALVRAKLIISE
ncbi:MAG: GDSL-type esterase/lipase family protein [Tannerella sp.]|jgi:lysophospholipase L1-like esterase|nr:GDSL-type esterase/lipase family protein [Tannerella sp.]